jgi:hypothetical protein
MIHGNGSSEDMQRFSLFYINSNNNMVTVRKCCLALGLMLMLMCEVVQTCLLQLNSYQHRDVAKLKGYASQM